MAGRVQPSGSKQPPKASPSVPFPIRADQSITIYDIPNLSLTTTNWIRERRRKYVEHVYIIFSVQVVLSFTFMLVEVLEPNAKDVLRRYFLWYALAILFIILLMPLLLMILQGWCFARRAENQLPVAVLLLCLVTVVLAVGVAIITVNYTKESFLIGFGISVLLCVALSLFAKFTKWDLSPSNLYCCLGAVTSVLLSIIVWYMSTKGHRTKWYAFALSLIGIPVFSWWLMLSTQRVWGGRKVESGPKDAMFGAFCLFIGTMGVFGFCVQLCGVLMA